MHEQRAMRLTLNEESGIVINGVGFLELPFVGDLPLLAGDFLPKRKNPMQKLLEINGQCRKY